MKQPFKMVGVMVFCIFGALAQNRTITGLVTDTERKGIYATIVVQGEKGYTETDLDGRFTLSVPKGKVTLLVEALGFTSKTVEVSARNTTVTVALNWETEELDEVVVTALGVEKDKRMLGYAVGQVKGEELTKAREINLGNALQGRVAGVNVSGTASGPAGSSRVVIRGATSASGLNQPLYVVDGIPIDNTQQGSAGRFGGIDRGDGLSSFNPDDIADISILKGSAASALYGYRGSNGVILITTKKGKASKGIGIEVMMTNTFESVLKTTDWQYEYGSGDRGRKPASFAEAQDLAMSSWGARLDGTDVFGIDGTMHPYTAQKNNMDHFYRTGNTIQNTVALTGGNEEINYRFSAGTVSNESIIPNSGFDRKNFTLSLNAVPNKKITLANSIQYIIEEANNRSYLSDAPKNPNYSVAFLGTNTDVRWLNPGTDENGFEARHFGNNIYTTTPYFATNNVKNFDRRDRFIGSSIITYNIDSHFYLKTMLGIDYIDYKSTQIEPTGLALNVKGAMETILETRYEYNVEGVLGYKNNLSENLDINAFVGANRQHNKSRGFVYKGEEFIIPFQYFYANTRNKITEEAFRESQVNSLFGSADLGYKNMLFLTLTGRQDWFSTLNPKSNSTFYPSLSSSFVYSDVIALPYWWNNGRMRVGWGNVGGALPEPYSLLLTYTNVGQGYLGQPLIGINGQGIPNSDLKPYNVRTTEVGTENTFFSNRLSLDLTWYSKTTTNDISDANVSEASGYTSTKINVGEISNKGIELQLNGVVYRTVRFSWNMGFNMGYNKSKVIKLADDLKTKTLAENRDGNAFIVLEEGQPFGIIKAYDFERNAQGEPVYNPNGTLRRGELITVGQGVAPYAMGFTTDFTYKNINLSILLDGKFGGKIFSSTNYIGYRSGLHKGTLEGREDGILVNGVGVDGNPVNMLVDAQDYWREWAYAGSKNFVYDSDFIKLRAITIGYAFPKSIIENTAFQSITVSFVARNLWVLYSKIPNVDPESNYQNGNEQGLERGGVPVTRSFGLNLNAQF